MELNETTFKQHVGRRIALCRSLRYPHMSQTKFCEHLSFYGISRDKKYMSNLENGHKLVRDYELQILANALCVTVSDLLNFHSLEHLKPIPQTYPLSDSCPPPLVKKISNFDIFYYRTEVLQQTQDQFVQTLKKQGLSVSRSTLSRIESGNIRLTAYAIFIIARTLGISCDSLFS